MKLGRTLKESGQDSQVARIHKNLLTKDAKLADEFFRELIYPSDVSRYLTGLRHGLPLRKA